MQNSHQILKRHSIGFFAFLVLVLASIASCKKLLEVPPPTNTLATNNVFSNNATVIADQLGVYARLTNNSLIVYELNGGLSSDELTNYASSNLLNQDLYHNNLNAQTDPSSLPYSILYPLIYQENAILENLPSASGISSNVKQQATGEAFFMRGFLYFQLVNQYGDVPLVTSSDYTKNSNLARTPAVQVYQQIISDLKASQGYLSPSYMDANDNTGAVDKVRPTIWAADALLARVYLYTSDYADAIKQATNVIQSGSYSLLPTATINNVFLKNSTEAIWQLMPPTATYNTAEGAAFVLITPPGNPGSGNIGVTMSPQLLNAFEANDARRTNWVGNYTTGGVTYYFPYKYKANSTSTTLTEYVMVLRLAEQYLIRAEAEANNNDPADAVNDLNVIRNRAGLPKYSGATDAASLTAAILHERQVELFTEGHRWYDLKRTKTVDAVMGAPGNVCQAKGGVWNSYQQLYPLIPTDIQYDPNLQQNPGY